MTSPAPDHVARLQNVQNGTHLSDIFNYPTLKYQTFGNLKRTFRKMSLLCHPDKCQTRIEQATNAITVLKGAFEMVEMFAEKISIRNLISIDDVRVPLHLAYSCNIEDCTSIVIRAVNNECAIIDVDIDEACDVNTAQGPADEPTSNTRNNGQKDRTRYEEDYGTTTKSSGGHSRNGNGTQYEDFADVVDVDIDPETAYFQTMCDDVEEQLDSWLRDNREKCAQNKNSGTQNSSTQHRHGERRGDDTVEEEKDDGDTEVVNEPEVSNAEHEFFYGNDDRVCDSHNKGDDGDDTIHNSDFSVLDESLMNGEEDGPAVPETHQSFHKKKRNACRRVARRIYRKRVRDGGREAACSESIAAESWLPRRVAEVKLKKGMCVESRWQCDRTFREHAAWCAPPKGIAVHKTLDSVEMTCRNYGLKCPAKARFRRHVTSGLWVMGDVTDHTERCRNGYTNMDNSSTVKWRTSPYTPHQISRLIGSYISDNPTLTSTEIARIVESKDIFMHPPSTRFFNTVRNVIRDGLQLNRAIQMAAMPAFTELLRQCGHQVELMVMSGHDMKATRIKSARFIFEQSKKAGLLEDDEVFDSSSIDVQDIMDDEQYYAGFIFMPSICKHMAATCRKTSAADAAHCQGLGPQSYGTTYEVVLYDTNNHITPICFAHSVATENGETWKSVFQNVATIDGFDCPGRVIVTDQEKGIDTAFSKVMCNAKLFLDFLHVKKNMISSLGVEKAMGPALYKRALWAPSQGRCELIKEEYGPKQKAYLSKFSNEQLYRSYAHLEDTITTSQGAESQMRASIRNFIRSAEPQQMIWTMVSTQRARFYEKKAKALACTSPVPPAIEEIIAHIIEKSKPYQPSVRFVEGSDMMEATVTSRRDGSQIRRVIFTGVEQTPPACCVYSRSGDGFPCWHGAAVICRKHNAASVYKYVSTRHLTAAWQKQYEGVEFQLPSQAQVDELMTSARQKVLSGSSVKIPLAIPPPRGRPPKNAGARLKSWYERGPDAAKRRKYTCALCGKEGHRRNACELKQSFEQNVGNIMEEESVSQADPSSQSTAHPTSQSS